MADSDKNSFTIKDPIIDEINKEVKTTSCELSINKIIAALHAKAFENANKVNADYVIQNSAIEGDEKNSKFYGAGQHLIAALCKKGTADKQIALDVIKTYVQWFAGPEYVNNIKEDNLFPVLPDENENKNNTDEPKKEAKFSKFPSFLSYITEEGEEETDDSKEKTPDTEDDTSDDIPEEKDEEKKEENKTDTENASNEKGFYITYTIKIEGQKEHPIADALKNFATQALKNFGIKLGNLVADIASSFGIATFSWMNGSQGEGKSILGGAIAGIKDAITAFAKIFEKINKDELKSEYDKQLSKKMPQSKAESLIFDTKTIQQHCKKWLSTKDKAALKTAEFAICTKVEKSDPSYKLYNQQLIADTLTKAAIEIGGLKKMAVLKLIKQAKYSINDKDVILINNYSDKDENREVGEVSDSIIIKNNRNIIKENYVSNITNLILKTLLEDIIIEEEPETSDDKPKEDNKEDIQKISNDITNEIKNIADNEVKTVQLPFDVEDEETKVWNIKELIKQLKDNGVNDSASISELEKYENALVVKLSKTVGNQDNKDDDIEDRSDDDEQLGTGESLITNVYNKLITEAVPAEQIKKQLLDVGKKIFDKVVSKFKDNLSENDSNEIINVEYENPTESIIIPSFNTFLLEAGKHTAAHIKQLIDKVGSKQIISNKDKIIQAIKDYYSNNKESEDTKEKLLGAPEKMVKKRDENGKIIKYTKDDERKSKGKHKKGEAKLVKQEAKPGILDDFFKLSDDDSMKKWVDNEFAEINKDSKDELPVQAFWKALSLLPEKEDNKDVIKITFRDIDDPSQINDFTSLTSQDKEKYKQIGDPVEVIPGEDFDIPEVEEKEGYKFDRWDPDPKEMKEDGYTYAMYQKNDTDQEDEPSDDDSIKPYQYLILPKNIISNEETNNKDAIKITFKDIDDPSKIKNFEELTDKDKEQYKQLGDPVEAKPGEKIETPEIKEKEGEYKFDRWDPEPSKMEKDGDTYAIYKKEKMNVKRTDTDFYIVPVKGLTNKTKTTEEPPKEDTKK